MTDQQQNVTANYPHDDRPPSAPPAAEARHEEYRSVFWPIVLIGVGAVWLLNNLGYIEVIPWTYLARLWPLALVGIGLDMLVGRRWPVLGALIGLGMVALVIGLILFGPRTGAAEESRWLGLPVIRLGGQEMNNANVQTSEFREALGNATTAKMSLRLHEGSTRLDGEVDNNSLIEAKLTHLGRINFGVSGDRDKTVTLEYQKGDEVARWFAFRDLPWEIHLSPRVPWDLQVRGGSGQATLKMDKLQFSKLALNGGSGSLDASLPAQDGKRYTVAVEGGSGSLKLNVASGADLDLSADTGSGSNNFRFGDGTRLTGDFKGGSGSTTIELPRDAEVRIEVRRAGSGSISLPNQLQKVSGGRDKEGVWETRGFDAKSRRAVTLILSGASGSMSVNLR